MPNPNGAVAGNAQNIPEAHVPRTRSTFKLDYHFFNTHRFAEYSPHFVAELNKDEVFPIRSVSTLRTYTLKSPLLQSIRRNKDYFMVPMESILPLNWEKFFDNPVRGGDVLDDVGPTVENFWKKVFDFCRTQFHNNLCQTILSDTSFSSYDQVTQATAIFRTLIIMEYFYSNGNLLSSLGCHGAQYFMNYDVSQTEDFDTFFDAVVSAFVNGVVTTGGGVSDLILQFDNGAKTYSVLFGAEPGDGSVRISFRDALQKMRDNPNFVLSESSPYVLLTGGIQAARSVILGHDMLTNFGPKTGNVPCNLSRLWAYQLCCAHYMTNDHIDFVYSAELFRQLIGSYIIGMTGGNTLPSTAFFTRNGIRYQYDFLSAHLFSWSISSSFSLSPNVITTSNSAQVSCLLGYLSALFGYRASLRYLDYFTGSRAQPLAVVGTQSGLNGGISTSVAVNANSVSVLDITKSIQAQRFLNSVNRVRHDFEGYLKGIFGGKTPAPDYHNPFYIAHTDDIIFGQETENTGSAQLTPSGSTDNPLPIAITTNLKARSNDFIFEVKSDRPCIVIGITSYDIPRVYSRSIERSFFHQNRFDWFNPFMQYIGDQPIYLNELGFATPGNVMLQSLNTWAYTLRHMEYKQRFNQCAGGFVHNLPGWLFIAHDSSGDTFNIDPDFIRSSNGELDRFYVSLTGWSLGTYFHFIVDDYNTCNASRPMAYAPSIL